MGTPQRRLPAGRLGLAAVLLAGCARTVHTPVDIEADIRALQPAEAEAIVVCVTEGPKESFGPQAGRYAVTGLWTDHRPEVTVQVYDYTQAVILQVGPTVLEDDWQELAPVDCSGGTCTPCLSPDQVPPGDDPSWVLGIRFEDPWDTG